MHQKHLLTLLDWSTEDLKDVLDYAHRMKALLKQEGTLKHTLADRTLALLFEKSSMRTRVSFEVAMTQLGGASLYLSKSDVNLGKREPVKDGARVMARYVDAISARVYEHAMVEELAEFSDVPVINALSNRAHPCQALADVMTVEERFKDLSEVTVSYVGDANNVARSLATACVMLGAEFRIAAPAGYQFEQHFLELVGECAAENDGEITQIRSPKEAARGAHVLYTDTWVSMGQEGEADQRLQDLSGFCIDSELLSLAAPDCIVMHCLPAYRGNEITDEVMEGPASAVWDQAENRLHAQRALLELMMTAKEQCAGS
ncbi:MAG: ornithine carbamoyltransferase [Planctomycetota bacterium]